MIGIVKGLLVTIRYAMFRKPVTVEYPWEERKSPHFRGMHKLDPDKCITCRLCAMICPNGSITIELKPGREKSRDIRDYDYKLNMGTCIWCGLCQEACPKDAVVLTPEFELSEYDATKLIRNLS